MVVDKKKKKFTEGIYLWVKSIIDTELAYLMNIMDKLQYFNDQFMKKIIIVVSIHMYLLSVYYF